MAVTTLLGLPIPSMSETVGKTIPDLASAMQIIDEKLGGSRIVDHNLDVVDPPNGWYWRREDGVQVCWGNIRLNEIGYYYLTNDAIAKDWDYPAAFDISPEVFESLSGVTGKRHSDIVSLARGLRSPTTVRLYAFIIDGKSYAKGDSVLVSVVAIGTWK